MSEAFQRIASFFGKHTGHVVEVEIFPPHFDGIVSDNGFFEEGIVLCIWKRGLVEAFLFARQLFNSRSIDLEFNTLQAKHILPATQVILLCDPEHITAANYRKRYLESNFPDTESFRNLLQNELVFIAGILTSPMHRQNKSPTLWYHRYWVIQQYHCWSSDGTKATTLFDSEMEIIFKAAERHPKNYNAWQYARRLLQLLDRSGIASEDMTKITSLMSSWCLRHTSDTSGWSFLTHLLSHPSQTEAHALSVIRRVLDLAVKFKWANGSLWAFLRTSLASLPPKASDARKALTTQLDEHRTPLEKRNQVVSPQETSGQPLGLQQKLDHAIDTTLNWIEKYSNCGVVFTKELESQPNT